MSNTLHFSLTWDVPQVIKYAMLIKGVCPHDCPDTCSWLVEVRGNKAVKMLGNPEHPITRGVLCVKVKYYLEKTYHPERVLSPLKRTGPKGEGKFEPVSWDEALQDIAEKLKISISKFGSESLLLYSYSGTLGLIQGNSMDRRFTHAIGASRLARTLCSDAGMAGYKYSIGATIGTPPEDFRFAKLIILWGTNTLTSNLHLWKFILEARRNGARIVAIDPIRTKTAKQADTWLPIRPGTDAALALSIMHVIISKGLIDEDYIKNYTIGFDGLRERVANWTPQRAARITGLKESDITSLAVSYATTKPAVIRINYGMQRHRGGGNAIRAISLLPALIGAWKYRGGGVLLSTSGAFPWNRSRLEMPELMKSPTRIINAVRLGDTLSLNPETRSRAIIEGSSDVPVKSLIVYNSNPATTAPDSNSVKKGLMRNDLFTVVVDSLVTDTALYADYVLPSTTQVEHWDLHTSYGHYFISLNRPAIPPIGKSKPNTEIFRLLAQKMGLTHPAFSDSDEDLIRQALDVDHPWLKGITFEYLLEHGFARLNLPEPFLPFKEGNFFTPSGKCEFYSKKAKEDGLDPLPNFIPPAEIPLEESEKLAFLSPSAHYYLNTNFANLERMRKLQGEPEILLHPEDARKRGIRDGDMVRVWNERGEIILKAKVSDDIRPGVCAAAYGIWWQRHYGNSINAVTSQREADMGNGATYYDVAVFVEKVQ